MPLVYQDTKGEYHPLLATYATEDAATWTYTIQDGMTWSDGAPVTAEDILFTLQYDQANGSANFEAQTGEDGKVTEAKYTGYSLSDDKMSISLTLASPNVRELSNMTSFRVMPKHIYEGKDTVSEAEGRITCGPYVLESFNKEAGTITFAVNEYYPPEAQCGENRLSAFRQRGYHVPGAPAGRHRHGLGLLHRCGRNLSGCTLHRYQCLACQCGCGQCACGPGL